MIGIAPTENEDGLEINSFDLVIRFNHINLKEKLDVGENSKTDITYLNGIHANNLFN